MKTKRFKITMLVTVEEIGPEPHETRPLVEELQTRPATWFPPEGDGDRQRRRRKGEHVRVKGRDDGSSVR